MDNLKSLSNIAEYLGLTNIVSDIEAIEMRSKQENANVILPLVGEFSSGKTTLINSLTDSRKLETATKPTTATIYEVHFGCTSCCAKVIAEDGTSIEVKDIALLKNESLTDAQVVTVFDTSIRVPSTTILVDTPGLSSPDPKHKQTLVNFLPKADGILLVTDINQQVTRSLTDFIDTMKLSKRPIYLILTKSDTKSDTDIETAKKYISENCQIPLKQMAVVSAATGSLDELYSLLDNIQKDKKAILKQVDGQRIKNIVNSMAEHVDMLMNASTSDDELDEAIRQCQFELDKIGRNIERLIESMSDDIEEQERSVSRKFEDTIFARLNTLVTGKSNNFDGEAISAINNTATLLMNDYKNSVQNILRTKANSLKGSDYEIKLDSLRSIDTSSIQMSGLSYNLDLNTMGHEYDGLIKGGIIAVALVGAVGAVAAAAPSGAAVADSVESAATIDNVIDVADTVSDIGSIVSNHKTAERIEEATESYSAHEPNTQKRKGTGSDKGMIDTIVGLVTDNMMSKPQRVRAIRNYMDNSLIPEFKDRLQNISQTLINTIQCNLQNEASAIIGQKTDSLNQLKQEKKEKNDLFRQRMEKLREFKTTLLTY